MQYTQEELDSYFFQKDALFDEIYEILSSSDLVESVYDKARSIRELIAKFTIYLRSDKKEAQIDMHKFTNYHKYIPDNLKIILKDDMYQSLYVNSRSAYKSQMFDKFIKAYSVNADRFVGYDLELLHKSYTQIYNLVRFELKENIKRAPKGLPSIEKYIFTDGKKFEYSKYKDLNICDVDWLFEAIFNRWNAYCWLRHIREDGKSYDRHPEILKNKKKHLDDFFYQILNDPINAKYERVLNLPFWHENPVGSHVKYQVRRLIKQPHIYTYKFANDFLNSFFSREANKSEIPRDDYEELYQKTNYEAVDVRGGRLLNSKFIPLLDILLLEEFYAIRFSLNSIANAVGEYNKATSVSKLMQKVEARFNIEYIIKLSSLYKYDEYKDQMIFG